MAAGEVCRRREGETVEENESTRRKLEEEADSRMILSRGGSEACACVGNIRRRDSPVVEEVCQIPSSECDLSETASSSVSCCLRSEEKPKRRMEDDGDQTETSWIYDNYNKRRDLEQEESVNIDSEFVEMKEVESRRMKKKKKRCETVKEAELEDFFQAVEKGVRNKMLECSSK